MKPSMAPTAAASSPAIPTTRSKCSSACVPVALKTAKPGTPEFREAIRQALMTEKEIAASQGVYNFTEKDRYGLDDRSRIILTVKDGKYIPAK